MIRKLKPIEVLKAQCEAQGVEFKVSERNTDYGPSIYMQRDHWQLQLNYTSRYWRVYMWEPELGWEHAYITDPELSSAIAAFLFEPEEPQEIQP